MRRTSSEIDLDMEVILHQGLWELFVKMQPFFVGFLLPTEGSFAVCTIPVHIQEARLNRTKPACLGHSQILITLYYILPSVLHVSTGSSALLQAGEGLTSACLRKQI